MKNAQTKHSAARTDLYLTEWLERNLDKLLDALHGVGQKFASRDQVKDTLIALSILRKN